MTSYAVGYVSSETIDMVAVAYARKDVRTRSRSYADALRQ